MTFTHWRHLLAAALIAGIYGMNFDYMPEATIPFGFALVLVVIAVSCLALFRVFRRNQWL